MQNSVQRVTGSQDVPAPSVDLPEPLAGYQPGFHARYPALAINLSAAALFCVAVPLLLYLTWVLQGRSPTCAAFPFTAADAILLWLAAFVTAALHEWLHGRALRLCGYQPSYGIAWRILAAYAGAFGQFQRRNHALAVALTPLLVITAVALPLLAAAQHTVVVLAFAALLVNTSGAVGDLYLVWLLLRLPRHALLYDVDPRHTLVFLPHSRHDPGSGAGLSGQPVAAAIEGR